MEDPVVGGYTPDKVALRRAIGLAYDVDVESASAARRHPRAVASRAAHGGYDPAYKSEMGDYDPTRAKALLDLYGYVDRDGDGWRELPDGKPLVLEMATPARPAEAQVRRAVEEEPGRGRDPDRLQTAQWPENLKAARAGKLMMWGSARRPPRRTARAPSAPCRPAVGQPEPGALQARRRSTDLRAHARMPDGPERDALFHEAKHLRSPTCPTRCIAHRSRPTWCSRWLAATAAVVLARVVALRRSIRKKASAVPTHGLFPSRRLRATNAFCSDTRAACSSPTTTRCGAGR